MIRDRDQLMPCLQSLSAVLTLSFALVATSIADEQLDWPPPQGDTPRLLYTDPYLPVKARSAQVEPEYLTLWLEALASPETDFQREAALAIARAHREGLLDCSSAEEALLRTLTQQKDAGTLVQTDTARALIAIGARDSAPELQARLNLGVQYARVVEPALAEWRGEGMRDIWLQRIRSQAETRRYELLLAVRCLGQTRETLARDALAGMLGKSGDVVLKLEAARSLGMIQQTGLEAVVTSMLSESDGRLQQRIIAVRLLRFHTGQAAIDLLLQLVIDKEPGVAATAIEHLIELDPQLIVSIARQTLQRRDARLRELIVSALAHVQTPATVNLLEPILGDAHPDVRRLARETLWQFTKDDALIADVLRAGESQLQSDDWKSLEQSSVLLGQLQHKPVARRLLQLVKQHARPEVCTAAAWALRMVEVPECLPDIFEVVENDYTRIMAQEGSSLSSGAGLVHLIETLGHMDYQPAEAHLRLWIPSGMMDSKPADARSAAVWSLGKLHADQEDPALTTTLLERINDPFEAGEVVHAAIIALGWMKSESAVRRLRPMMVVPVREGFSLTIAWADNQATGRPMPPMDTQPKNPGDWFLVPIGSRIKSDKPTDD
jgi:HEAT repeat protein